MKEDGSGLLNKLNKTILMEMSKNSKLTLSSMNKAIHSLLQKCILELNEDTGFSRFNPPEYH